MKIYLDEDVHTFIAHALRLRGWEALTTEEARRRGAGDRDQIAFATNNGYAIVSYNVRDFPRLHYEITSDGGTHMGIIVGSREDPRRNVRALLHLLDKVSAEAMRDQLVYLNNWA
ncbi:MAG: DUF5615 family PIN-like protein [Deltaproteobacteria bacterium]|nr:DUF5615 family PIN-like protein [Deltaproteobacteria bacterium]